MKPACIALWWFPILLGGFSTAQVTVDPDQLTKAVREKLIGDITEKITASVEAGEQWVADATYFSVVLEPFEPFGVDPGNPNFLNQAYEIHSKIKEELEQNPELRYNTLLKKEIRDIVESGLWNYASSCIDDDSKEIVDQVSELLSDGQGKIKELLEAAEGIANLDEDVADYESEVTAVLKKYGVRSDYFYLIDDLDLLLSKGYEKIEEPLKALSMISEAAGSDDPVFKIEMLLELGETFGGKVPVIGELITPVFKLGKGVLDAAKRLENLLEKNLNQGCISPAGGTYGSTNPGKRSRFIRQFPEVTRACPLNQDVWSPVYNQIYVNTSDAGELFFYLNDEWIRGKKDNLHRGGEDIFAAVQWLRRKNMAEQATQLDFLTESYQKEYGWSVYTREVSRRIQKIKSLFMQAYQTVSYCDGEALKRFFMEKTGLDWLSRLLSQGGTPFGWQDMVNFNSLWEKEILDQMIQNYYLERHQHNLNRLDEIIRQLTENTPVNLYGVVKEAGGGYISGAILDPGGAVLFEGGEDCRKLTTAMNGAFSFFVVLPLEAKVNVAVTADLPDGRDIGGRVEVTPSQDRFYELILRADELPRDTAGLAGNGNQDDGQPDLSAADCGNDPLATPRWDPVNKVVICTCPDNYLWNDASKKCEPDIQKILANADCSGFPNTQAKWDYENNEPYCDCLPGFAWNKDYTACVELKNQLLASADCSGYPNTQPVWDETAQTVKCDCLPGFKWNKEFTGCIPEWQDALRNFDCSKYPNTEPVWDPVRREVFCNCLPGFKWKDDYSGCVPDTTSQNILADCSSFPNTQPVFDQALNQYFCDCLPGYRWNKEHTGCVPERKKPAIDWNALYNLTMGILSTATGNVPGTNTPFNAGQTQQPVVKQSNCNEKSEAGGDAPEVHYINLGQSFGSFKFDFQVYDIKDQIIITQGGALIYDSGCISGSGSLTLPLTGAGNQITVRVNPNCERKTDTTAWNFLVHCPGNP